MNTITTVYILAETRDELAQLFRGVGVEVGVCDGFYSEYIMRTNPKVIELYGVDPFIPLDDYKNYVRASTIDAYHKKAVAALAPYPDYKFIKKISMEAVHDFEDNSLDFVYIDANHNYKHCSEDIREWAKKVKSGGIISGDDYVRRKNQDEYYDVVRAVDDYVAEHEIPELFIYKKRSPTNWMFRKP